MSARYTLVWALNLGSLGGGGTSIRFLPDFYFNLNTGISSLVICFQRCNTFCDVYVTKMDVSLGFCNLINLESTQHFLSKLKYHIVTRNIYKNILFHIIIFIVYIFYFLTCMLSDFPDEIPGRNSADRIPRGWIFRTEPHEQNGLVGWRAHRRTSWTVSGWTDE